MRVRRWDEEGGCVSGECSSSDGMILSTVNVSLVLSPRWSSHRNLMW